jgi:hypothetical protein
MESGFQTRESVRPFGNANASMEGGRAAPGRSSSGMRHTVCDEKGTSSGPVELSTESGSCTEPMAMERR